MKYVRWLLLGLLLLCFFNGFQQRPFFKELPMLLLPEPNSDVIMEKSNYNAYDDALDPRPICIQTKNNFSYFLPKNHLEEDHIISYLKLGLSLNGANLLDDKIIATPQKDFSPEISPVWVTKRVPLRRVVNPKIQKPLFIPKE